MGGSGGGSNPSPTGVGGPGPAQGHGVAGDSIVLEEEIDPNYVPTQEEVREYAKWLGMELEDDRDLFWIAKEGLKAPLPENWKPCKTVDTDEIYYFNFATGESTWDHPCDEYYRKLYEEEKKKKITKDKAKHDKSKQQAKKDVNQLLGRSKKKKGRAAGKSASHQPSPERIEAVPSPASSIFDRKPLPGIGRQPLQPADALAYQASTSPPTQPDKAAGNSDRSPSRAQASSLVGQRLSQHLSVSVESEEGGQKADDRHASLGDRSTKVAASRGPLRSREEDTRDKSSSTNKAKSDYATELKELQAKYARELDTLEQAHNDMKDRLEDDHRRELAAQKRQLAATAEAQAEKGRDALKRELENTRSKHAREIDALDSNLIEEKVRLERSLTETKRARDVAISEKHDLELTLTTVRREISEEGAMLQETKEVRRKVQLAEASPIDDSTRSELVRVVSELEHERRHVAELEHELKEANNSMAVPFLPSKVHDSNPGAILTPANQEYARERVTLLEDKLAATLSDNEVLKKEAARATAAHVNDRREDGCTSTGKGESKSQHLCELVDLKKALEEVTTRCSQLEEEKGSAAQLDTCLTTTSRWQDAKNAAAALVDVRECLAGVESDNSRLEGQVTRLRQQAGSADDALRAVFVDKKDGQDNHTQTCLEVELAGMRATPSEHEAAAAARRHEVDELRAGVEASRNEVERLSDEVARSKERESLVCDELHAAQLALHESQLKHAELNCTLATADHEKELGTATVEQLRLEGVRLQEELVRMQAAAEGDDSQDATNALVNEIKELRIQLARTSDERGRLNAELGTLKQQLAGSEGVLKAERAMFEGSQANQQRQVISLQIAVKLLEAEVAAGKRTDQSPRPAPNTTRERNADSQAPIRRTCREDEFEVEMVSAVDLKRAVAAADEAIREARELASDKCAISSRLKLAEEQVVQLQRSLHETMGKLAAAETEAASAQLASERSLSTMVSEEKVAEARLAEQAAKDELMEANARCTRAEQRLAQACKRQAKLECSLRETVSVQDAQAQEFRAARGKLSALLEKESRTAACQTVDDELICDTARKVLQSQNELETARASVASGRQLAAELRQELADSAAKLTKATDEVHQNEELASARWEEINSLSKREKILLEEMDQARISHHDTETDRRCAAAAAEEATRRLAEAERGWHREAHCLRVSLEDALARADGKEERKTKSLKSVRPSPGASATGMSTPGEPDVVITKVKPNQGRRPSFGYASDATSQGLAEELMQKLTEETSKRRSARQAQNDKASRSWAKKLEAEKRMLALGKQVLRHHKERVKKRQNYLLLGQTRWREQRRRFGSAPPTNVRHRHSSRQRSLDEAKLELDREVFELNNFVHQLRTSKVWLDTRERKISDFEALLEEDESWSQPRPDPDSVSTVSSGAPSSSPESSDVTNKLRSLEAMQQELDNDISDFTVWNAKGELGEHPISRDYRRGTQARRSVSKQGKENTFSSSPPTFHAGYPPFFSSPVASRFWGHQPPSYMGEVQRSRDGLPIGFKAKHRQHKQECKTYSRLDGRFRTHFPAPERTMDDAASSESELHGWLNRPELESRRNMGSGVAARERTGHIAKLTVEGRQAHSTVALHVDWLNTLRQEMGLLASSSQPRASATSVAGLSTAVDALTSPRRVVKASLIETQRAQDVN